MDIDRVRSVISQMKLSEKLAFVGGGTKTAAINRLKVPSIDMGDGVMPYSANEPSTLALGCTFSHTLCAAVGKMRGAAAIEKKEAFSGAIACGVMTDPMRADCVDFFSEDCYLTAELLDAYSGSNELGFVFTDALGQGRYSNRTIDGRALNELYLYPLMRAGKHSAGVMLDGGYLNGKQVTQSREIADTYAKYVPQTALFLTPYDYGNGYAVVSGNGAYRLSNDETYKRAVNKAVVDGMLYEKKLDLGIERTVATVARTYEIYKKSPKINAKPVDITVDSTVLLKNDGALPLKGDISDIGIFGEPDWFDDGELYKVFSHKDISKKSNAVKVILVTDYAENGIPSEVTTAINENDGKSKIVLVLCGGSATHIDCERKANAIMFCPFVKNIASIITMLTTVSPRGHLPFSWAKSKNDYPRNNPKYSGRGDFRYESVYNGYRLFNNFKSDLLYPFGHGLDYANYEISQYSLSCDKLIVTAEFVIKNVGELAGSALCQLYITPLGGNAYGTGKRLAGFKRVALETTENARVKLQIDLNEFPIFDEANQQTVTVGGKYRVELGLSSKDNRASAEVKVPAGSRATAGLSETLAPSYYKSDSGVAFEPTAPEIERLLKVPFIKKPDEYDDILPPEKNKTKKVLKRIEKLTPKRLLPVVRYKVENTPINK